MDLLNIISSNTDIDQKINLYNEKKEIINSDSEIDELLKSKSIAIIDISIASMEYWDAQNKGLPWYAKDAAGGTAAITSGATEWGAIFGGPLGALGVTLGVAAVSSMID